MKKVKKIAVVTFHRAHNFGSVLQTYALQEYVRRLCKEAGAETEYTVIDFYTEEQENLYKVFKSGFSPKNLLKNIIALKNSKALKIKHRKFSEFIAENFNTTKRYKNAAELKLDTPAADYYISGSDQIWNVRAKDFSDIYYLDFVNQGKKISYAASFGPLKIDWSVYNKEKYSALLSQYSAISVRETGSADNVKSLIGKNCEVNIDPTFLLTKEQWKSIQSDANYNDGNYILLYCLEPSKEQLSMAKAISKKLNLPILVTRYNNKNDMINSFVKKYDCGPLDFLSYIDNAALVLSSSFHGTAFSMIYNKPFYVFGGMNDSRISSILKIAGIEERSVETFEDIDRVNLQTVDFSVVNKIISEERIRTKEYLKKALSI